jgi:Domain of unknown function (DUF397)
MPIPGDDPASYKSTPWFKSSYSGAMSTCVQLRFHHQRVDIGDSKFLDNPGADPEQQPIITLSIEQWHQFLAEFTGRRPALADLALAVERNSDSTITLRCTTTQTGLTYNADEWAAFVAGAHAGEFGAQSLVA